MNRIIKFRAWEPSTKSMHYDLSFYADNGGAIMAKERPIIGGILLQYTGLKDKNGKEIYEGDLLAEIDHINELEAWGKPIIVEWGEYKSEKDTFELSGGTVGFVVRYFDGSINGIHLMDDTYGFKSIDTIVLGNIYETPELLK